MRTTVVVPEGVQTALEEALEERYGLREAIVVELLDDSEASSRVISGPPPRAIWRRA